MTPADRRVHQFAGDGETGFADGPFATARFYEPGGLAAAGDSVYVADTNNHAIRRIDLTSNTVQTVHM
jgi:hypothetical protein